MLRTALVPFTEFSCLFVCLCVFCGSTCVPAYPSLSIELSKRIPVYIHTNCQADDFFSPYFLLFPQYFLSPTKGGSVPGSVSVSTSLTQDFARIPTPFISRHFSHRIILFFPSHDETFLLLKIFFLFLFLFVFWLSKEASTFQKKGEGEAWQDFGRWGLKPGSVVGSLSLCRSDVNF